MSNETQSNFPSFYKNVWIPVLVVTSLQIVAVSWISFCFVAYLRRHRRNINSTPTNGKHTNVLLYLAIGSYTTSLIRFVTSQVAIISERVTLNSSSADWYCEATVDATEVSFFLCLCLTYVFYFARQHILYIQPSMQQLNTRVVRTVRYVAILLIVSLDLAAALIFLLPERFEISEVGCVVRNETDQGFLPNVVGLVIRTCAHLVLLGLLVYPLVVKYIETDKSVTNFTKKKVLNAFWQTSFCMLACVVSDFLAAILFLTVIPRSSPTTLVNCVYDVNSMINVVSIIFCFENNRKVMLGSYRRVKTSKVKSQYVDRRSLNVSVSRKSVIGQEDVTSSVRRNETVL